MKRILMILITAGAALIIASPTNAQGYYTTSYSYSYNNWDLPYYVRSVVTDHYHGCGIVNARSYYVNGYLSYNLFLTNGNSYVEIEVDRFGYVTRRITYNAFPTHHVWVNNFSVYYKPQHSHYHNGHHKNNHHSSHYNHHTTNNYYVDYSSKKGNGSGNNSNSYNNSNNVQRRESNVDSRSRDQRVTQRPATNVSSQNQRIANNNVQNSRYDRNITSNAQSSNRGRK